MRMDLTRLQLVGKMMEIPKRKRPFLAQNFVKYTAALQ